MNFRDQHIRTLLTTCLFLRYFVRSGYGAECQSPTRKTNMVFTEETLLKNEFLEGSEATLLCAKGYHSVGGSGTATCRDGMWSDTDLDCQKNDCGLMEEVPHMTNTYPDGTLFGATAYVECELGYDIVGSSYIECYPTGWISKSRCEVVTCEEPSTIENGKISNSYKSPPEYGTIIEYSCNDGYILVGNSSLTCTEYGDYSSSPPTCQVPAVTSPSTEEPNTEPPSPLKTTTIATSTVTPLIQDGDEEKQTTNSPNNKGGGHGKLQEADKPVFLITLLSGLVIAVMILIYLIYATIRYNNRKGSLSLNIIAPTTQGVV